MNVTLGPREDRMLITGLHTVCDIHCITCNCVLGWKYEVRAALGKGVGGWLSMVRGGGVWWSASCRGS